MRKWRNQSDLFSAAWNSIKDKKRPKGGRPNSWLVAIRRELGISHNSAYAGSLAKMIAFRTMSPEAFRVLIGEMVRAREKMPQKAPNAREKAFKSDHETAIKTSGKARESVSGLPASSSAVPPQQSFPISP